MEQVLPSCSSAVLPAASSEWISWSALYALFMCDHYFKICVYSLASPQDKAPAVKGQYEAADAISDQDKDPKLEPGYLQQDDSANEMEFEGNHGSDDADLSDETNHDAPAAGEDEYDDDSVQQLNDPSEQPSAQGLTNLLSSIECTMLALVPTTLHSFTHQYVIVCSLQ